MKSTGREQGRARGKCRRKGLRPVCLVLVVRLWCLLLLLGSEGKKMFAIHRDHPDPSPQEVQAQLPFFVCCREVCTSLMLLRLTALGYAVHFQLRQTGNRVFGL